MSLGEPVGHLSGNREQFAQRKRTGIEQLPQRLSIHQLHDDERGGIALPDFVDGHDIGMVQGGDQTRLRLEALQAGRVGRQLGGQDLDRDLALKPRVPGAVNFPHPARPERAQHLVRAEPRNRGNGHRITGEIISPDGPGRLFPRYSSMAEAVEAVCLKMRKTTDTGPILIWSSSARASLPVRALEVGDLVPDFPRASPRWKRILTRRKP